MKIYIIKSPYKTLGKEEEKIIGVCSNKQRNVLDELCRAREKEIDDNNKQREVCIKCPFYKERIRISLISQKWLKTPSCFPAKNTGEDYIECLGGFKRGPEEPMPLRIEEWDLSEEEC